MEKTKKQKAKSLICYAPADTLFPILNASVYTLLSNLEVSKYSEQIRPEELRSRLQPAYVMLADVLGRLLREHIDPDLLFGLSLELSPPYGLFKASVIYGIDDAPKNNQRYTIHFRARDGLNPLLRQLSMPVHAVGSDKYQEAVDKYGKL